MIFPAPKNKAKIIIPNTMMSFFENISSLDKQNKLPNFTLNDD